MFYYNNRELGILTWAYYKYNINKGYIVQYIALI